MLKVPGSTSTKTGRAPRYPSTSAVAVKVNGVVMTSSPGPMPSAHSARCSAPVQCETASACFAPTYFGEFALETLGLGAGGDPSGAQGIDNLALLVGTDRGTMKGNLSH